MPAWLQIVQAILDHGAKVRHGHFETREIWISNELNGYLSENAGFASIAQVFRIVAVARSSAKASRTSAA